MSQFDDIDLKDYKEFESTLNSYQANRSRHLLKLKLWIVFGLIAAFALLSLQVWLFLYSLAKASYQQTTWIIVQECNFISIIIFLASVLILSRLNVGYKLSRRKFPKIYQKLDLLTKDITSSKIDCIVINSGIEATIYNHFSLRRMRSEKMLFIGYPLLCSSSTNGLRGIIASEIFFLDQCYTEKNFLYKLSNIFWECFFPGVLFIFVLLFKFYYEKKLSLLVFPLIKEQREIADELAKQLNEDFFYEGMANQMICGVLYDKDNTVNKLLLDNESSKIDFSSVIRDMFKQLLPDEIRAKYLERCLSINFPIYMDQRSFSERTKDCSRVHLLALSGNSFDAYEFLVGDDKEFENRVNDYYACLFMEKDMIDEEEDNVFSEKLSLFEQLELINSFSPEEATSKAWLRFIRISSAYSNNEHIASIINSAIAAYPKSLSLRAVKLSFELKVSDNKVVRQKLADEMKQLIKISPLFLPRVSEALFNYYMSFGSKEEIKQFLSWRADCKKSLSKIVKQKIDYKKDDLREINLSNSQKRSLELLIKHNYNVIEKLYAFERYYDNAPDESSCCLLLKLKSLDFRLSEKPHEIRAQFLGLGFDVIESDKNEIKSKLLDSRNIPYFRKE